MTNAAKAQWAASIDMGIKVAFPILLGISGWAFMTLQDHEQRIVVIESSRYTRKEADAANSALRSELAHISNTLARIEERVSSLTQRLIDKR